MMVIELDRVGKRYRLGNTPTYGRLTESLDRVIRWPRRFLDGA